MSEPHQEIVVLFHSNTEANTTLHVKKLTMVTRYGARLHTTTTQTTNGEIVVVSFSSSV